jgi:hypothetical protein
MEPIHVPGPPKEAFNKNRPISDLIRAQVNHLKHVEASLPADQRSKIPQHEISTESDAANYIAAMTHLFQSKAAAAPAKPTPPLTVMTPAAPVTPVPIKPAPPVSAALPVSTAPGLAMAASASPTPKKTKSKNHKAKKAKSPAKERMRKKK